MKHLLSLNEFSPKDMSEIFSIAERIKDGGYKDFFFGKTVVMFFPDSSLRTRVTFEKGVHGLSGQAILFPPETLDKKEAIEDVSKYLNQWADAIVIRHKRIDLLYEFLLHSKCPIINAMTDSNHPCEILSDIYALSKRRNDYKRAKYLFVGPRGNIGNSWKEAADAFGFSLRQCCPKGYEIPGLEVVYDISEAIKGMDIVCTDSIPSAHLDAFDKYQINTVLMEFANEGALLNPCPPFYRGQEVSAEVINSKYFVGYEFKKELLPIQQAILIYCMSN